jgi:preprotein translocase subunit SecA
MSSLALPYSSQHWARACPYAERARPELQWHDRTALALDSTLLAPLRDLLQRDLRVMRRVAQDALSRAEAMDALGDDELRALAASLRPRLRALGYTPELVAETFALIRSAAARSLGQQHFASQLMAGYALLRGRLAEMATGEGKTFCATLPACTVALAGYPVHVITVNDYLAKRDAEKMQPLYDFLGLSVGVVVQGMEKPLRRAAYAQDITYATNKEVAFDYLRDRVAIKGRGSRLHQAARVLRGQAEGDEALVMRGLYYALVDEADSVFIDEARTPLILSASRGGAEDMADCAAALALAAELDEGEDYRVDPQAHRVVLTDAGQAQLDDYAEEHAETLGGVWTSPRAREERLRQALAALHLYRRDEQYVVAEDKVQIVDESTGRLMPDRSWERGLHQMIEAKEGVAPTPRRETLARLTYQRLFRRYLHLSGMTGTAAEAAREIRTVYGLQVVRVPLNRPSRRVYLPDVLLPTLAAKWEAVAASAQAMAAQGRPVLIGTRSVRASEQISAVLTAHGIAHALLNAKQDADEAAVVSEAGQAGRVTVATNMAGRGTDIELGEGVDARGGLHVILTEFHDSRRVDRQLFGRSARQGDAGSCQAIVSLEDEVFTVAVPGPTALLQRLLSEGRRLPAGASAALRWLAQWMTERRHTAVRLSNLKQDRQLDQSLAFTGKGE